MRAMRREWIVAFAVACGGGHAAHDAAIDTAPDARTATAPDLRLKWVTGVTSPIVFGDTQNDPIMLPSAGLIITENNSGFGQFTFAPLQLLVNDLGSSGAYSWNFGSFTTQAEIEPIFGRVNADVIGGLDVDIASDVSAANAGVVTSLDVVPGACAWVVQGVQNGPTYPMVGSDVGSDALAAYVASEGSAARVVTALSASPTAGLLRVYSHGREGDGTMFTTTVVSSTAETFVADTAALAGSGYIVTAVGHVGDDALVLVGTQPVGSTTTYTTTTQTSLFGPTGIGSAALIGWVSAFEGSGSDDGSDFLNEMVLEQ
jgi:hypothetical protein